MAKRYRIFSLRKTLRRRNQRNKNQATESRQERFTVQRWTLRVLLFVAVLFLLTLALDLVGTSGLSIAVCDCLATSILLIAMNTSADFMDKMLFTTSLSTYRRLLRAGLLTEEY